MKLKTTALTSMALAAGLALGTGSAFAQQQFFSIGTGGVTGRVLSDRWRDLPFGKPEPP
jgi:hypothetical protein